jgi:hypothetical protein
MVVGAAADQRSPDADNTAASVLAFARSGAVVRERRFRRFLKQTALAA